jgi:hypothetical protein
VLAGNEFDRGVDPFWLAVYQATTMLWPPMLLGIAVWPVARAARREASLTLVWALHGAALAFARCGRRASSRSTVLFGTDHAGAVLMAGLLWRSVWGLVVCGHRHRLHRGAAGARRACGGGGRGPGRARWPRPSCRPSAASSTRISCSTR